MVDFNQNDSSNSALDELNVTLTELSKALDNLNYMQQSIKSLGISKKNISALFSSSSITNLMKGIDMKQLMALAQSPLIQNIIKDPEFYQLFTPDTGTTPGTKPNTLQTPDEEPK